MFYVPTVLVATLTWFIPFILHQSTATPHSTFNKPLMGTLVIPGLSWGILLGALVIVSAWVLIYIYVRWANSNYDEKITQIMNK
jgi:uncharacterized membrane protein (DUF485 family)